MMVGAQQNQIVVPVALLCCLPRVISRTLRACRFDMANLADDNGFLHNRARAFRKGAAIPRVCEQPLNNGLARTRWECLPRHRAVFRLKDIASTPSPRLRCRWLRARRVCQWVPLGVPWFLGNHCARDAEGCCYRAIHCSRGRLDKLRRPPTWALTIRLRRDRLPHKLHYGTTRASAVDPQWSQRRHPPAAVR